jgi:hypothetical protein
MSLFFENNQDLPEGGLSKSKLRRLPGLGSRVRRHQRFLENKNQSLQDSKRRQLLQRFEHGYFDDSEVECLIEQKDVEIVYKDSDVLDDLHSVPNYDLEWLYSGLSEDYCAVPEPVEIVKDSLALIQTIKVYISHLKVEEYGIHYNDAVLTTLLCTMLQSHHHYHCQSCSNTLLHSSMNPFHDYVKQFGKFGSVSIKPDGITDAYRIAKNDLYQHNKFNGHFFSVKILPYLKRYHVNCIGLETKEFFNLYSTMQTIFGSRSNTGSNGIGFWTADYHSIRPVLPNIRRINWNDAIMAYYFDTFSSVRVERPYDDAFYIKVNCNLLAIIHKKLSYNDDSLPLM